MSRSAVPQWVWLVCGVATLVAAILWLTSGGEEAPKPKELISIYGDKLDYLNEGYLTTTGHPKAFLIGMPVDQNLDEDAKEAKADTLFLGYAGARAEELGYRRVLIRPDDGRSQGGVNIFGFRLWMHVDVGAGPAIEEDGLIAYDKSADGVWNRSGTSPKAPERFDLVKLPSGATFALTYSLIDFPSGWFVYDCLTCRLDNAAREISQNVYPFLQAVVAHEPLMQGLTKAKIAMFLGARRSKWEFPVLMKLSIAKHGSEWVTPKLSGPQLEKLIQKYEQTIKANNPT